MPVNREASGPRETSDRRSSEVGECEVAWNTRGLATESWPG